MVKQLEKEEKYLNSRGTNHRVEPRQKEGVQKCNETLMPTSCYCNGLQCFDSGNRSMWREQKMFIKSTFEVKERQSRRKRAFVTLIQQLYFKTIKINLIYL